jgi:hypothetical protein
MRGWNGQEPMASREVGDTAYRLLICLERERRGTYARAAVSSAYAEQYTLLEFIE